MMSPSRLLSVCAVPAFAMGVPAQQAAAPPSPVLSPGAALRQALRPFETTRNSMANWSPIEQAAYGVAVNQADAACVAVPASAFSGDDLLDQARLCGLGLDYAQAHSALERFLATNPNSPRLNEALALDVDATLHLKDKDAALSQTRQLLALGSYSPVVSDASNEAIGYMETLFTADALGIARQRQPLILARLAAMKGAPAANELDRATLYRDGLRLAALLQLSHQAAAAQQTVQDLDGALGMALTPDETVAINAQRRLYALLNQPIGQPPGARYLLPGAAPSLAARGTATALLVFPDWCAQCIRMAHNMPQGVFFVEGHRARAFSLLAESTAQTPAQGKPAELGGDVFSPAMAEQYLAGTATFAISPDWLTRWGATEVPLLVVADASGTIRYAAAADESAVQPGRTLDSLVVLLDKTWPAPPAKPVRSAHPAR